MSGLTDEDREALGDWWNDGTEYDLTWDLTTLAPVVEQIVARHVAAALNTAADEIESVARDSREAAEFASGPGAEARHRTRSSGLRAAARIVRRREQAG